MALGFGFNKAKVLAQAEKFVQQGKLSNAITEYEKIIKEDPKDLTVLNTVGDLCARMGNNDQATYYFKTSRRPVRAERLHRKGHCHLQEADQNELVQR